MERDALSWRAGNPERPSLRYVFLRFLRHGLLAWGGPVAQIAHMHRELVERDAWVTEARFRKQLAVYQALPGPEANELAVWFGTVKRGRWGGLLAGLGFMLPGVLLVTLLAALYVRYATTMAWADVVLYGVRPAVLALIVVGFLRLARASLRGLDLLAIGLLSAAAAYALPQVSFLLLLLAGGLVVAALRWASARGRVLTLVGAPLALALVFPALSASGLGALALLSAKVGLLTFGGAYTAIPFLHQGAVVDHGWITEDQFLDALALSGMVPGPLIAVAVFIAYQAAGLAGAALATIIVFAPAFAFTLVGHGFFERIVDEPRLHDFLLGVTAAVIGLILVAVLPLAQAALVDAPTMLVAVSAGAALWRWPGAAPLVILAAGAAGALLQLT